MTEPTVHPFAAITLWSLTALATAQQTDTPGAAQSPGGNLTDMSLEDLMKVEVEVGSRHEESWFGAASPVFVLDSATIRRSGLRSIPDLLRLVPGLVIAQDVPGAFSFSSRIGEVQFAGMLVLLDGQRLYPTLLRREIWQVLDLPIEDIERIEVVRGPGGSRWGDRAANGVVNIVTVDAKDAHGALVTGTVGTEERWTTTFRQGAALADGWNYYVYGKLGNRDGGYPNTAGDRWRADRAGIRIDGHPDDHTHYELDVDAFDSFIGDSYLIDPGFSEFNNIRGGHVKGHAHWHHADGSQTEARIGLDWYDQDIDDHRNNALEDRLRWNEYLLDATVQHSIPIGASSRLTFGVGGRHLTVHRHRLSTDTRLHWNESRADVFAAWDWDVTPELRFSLGGNVGYEDGRNTTGLDVQPDVRLAWRPDDAWTVWGSISGNEQQDFKFIDSTGLLVREKSGSLVAYEVGVRHRIDDSVLADLTTYLYDYNDQLTEELTGGGGETIPVQDGETRAVGGELSLTWQPDPELKLTAWSALTQANARDFPDGTLTIEHEVPQNRSGARIDWDFAEGFELDANAFYVERHNAVPSYIRLDLRLGWRPNARTDVAIVGQNLLDAHHPENFFLEQSERGAYLLVTHRF